MVAFEEFEALVALIVADLLDDELELVLFKVLLVCCTLGWACFLKAGLLILMGELAVEVLTDKNRRALNTIMHKTRDLLLRRTGFISE